MIGLSILKEVLIDLIRLANNW